MLYCQSFESERGPRNHKFASITENSKLIDTKLLFSTESTSVRKAWYKCNWIWLEGRIFEHVQFVLVDGYPGVDEHVDQVRQVEYSHTQHQPNVAWKLKCGIKTVIRKAKLTSNLSKQRKFCVQQALFVDHCLRLEVKENLKMNGFKKI